jgi:hypothetical protein
VKPVLFIGSSSESLDIAYAAQENLEDCAQAIVWKQGLFDLSRNFLDSLLDTLDEANFGLFVFAPDDLTRIRGHVMETARDNVVFELGLFIGRLGRERTFIIMPKDNNKDNMDLHLPSDLLGINTASFAQPENPELLLGALGAACNQVRRAIRKVDISSQKIGSLNLALSLAVPEPQQRHLLNLAEGRTKGYEGRGSLRFELRDLVSMGLLEKLPDRHIGDMKSGMVYDLANFVNLTDRGRLWVDRIKSSY